MKSKILISVLLLSIIAAMISGCGAKDEDYKDISNNPQTTQTITTDNADENETETDYTQIYREVLDGFYSLIINWTSDYEVKDGETGVVEAIAGKKTDDALSDVGYVVKDISADGIPELLIMAVAEEENSAYFGSKIYAVYTCVGSSPVLVLEGRSRSNYSLMDNGQLFYQGSDGAASSIFGTFSVSKDGTSLICEDYYFSCEKEDNPEEIGYFHNSVGEPNEAVSDELAITTDEFLKLKEEPESKIQNTELTPFSALANPKSYVSARFAENALSEFSDYDEFTADTDESQVKVMFTCESTVKDFKFLELTFKDVDEEGKTSFDVKEMYSSEELTPERPLVVGMSFYGSIAHYGISYIDENGTTRSYAVDLSGEDGSVILWEF